MAVVGTKTNSASVGDIFFDVAGARSEPYTPWRVQSVNIHGEAEWVIHSPPDVAKATGVSEHDTAIIQNAYAASADNHIANGS